MKTPRWIEQPRTLAALTLAFALVPAGFAFLSFKAARERDARLFDTAAQVLGEQFKQATFRHVTFLNVMRNQWRTAGEQSPALPGGWQSRFPHLLAVAYASHDSEQRIPLRWQDGRALVEQTGENLADDPVLADLLRRTRLGPPMMIFSAQAPEDRLLVAEAVPDAENLQMVRGYIVGWVDLRSLCTDASLPLLHDQALHASLVPDGGRGFEISGEGEVKWTTWITRGPQFGREYGTPTPWVGFAALGLSVLPLSVLVMLASRAGKLRAALEAEKLKNQFVSTVSHEFRTPLSVILSGAELLEVHAASLSEIRRLELLAQIKASTTRMHEMVEQVLLLGRIDSGTMIAHPQPVDVTSLCRDILEEVQTATQQRCEIKLEITPDVAGVAMDTALARSILVNVLGNAVKYSRPGGKVVFAVQRQDSVLRFLVTDEGIGIPVMDQARLGEPFHRATNVGEVAGTGLGLTVVKRCLALCGGSLTILSEEGQGTLVIVTLPS